MRYRDVSLAIPFLILVLLFLTPILYPLSLVPDSYHALYSLNPLVGVMETFRWTMLADAPGPGALAADLRRHRRCCCWSAGSFYFARAEQRFADVI